MPFAPPHDVYSRSLLGAHGYPLWTPQLKTQLCESYQLEGLKVGDVGVVSSNDGSFDVLFNITLERDEQPYPELVQENFTPLVLDPKRDLATQPDAVAAHGVISSASVELVSLEVHSCDQEPSKADYEFSLSIDDGAVLILPEGAESCDLASEKTFLGEAIRHGMDWYECATEKAGRLISNDSLYLITGFHKARSWSLGAAGRNHSSIRKHRSVKFKVGQIRQDSVTARAYLWAATHGFTGRVGPTYPYEIPNHVRGGVNQTVFIRGFRITVNKILFLKTISVKTRQGTFFGFGTYLDNLLWGRPSDSAASSGTEGATDNVVDQDFSIDRGRLYTDKHMTIDRMPDVSQTFHPGDLINQYMLKKEPRAMIALTHDRVWIEMHRMGLLELADFSCEERLEEVLSKNYRIVVEEGAVYLQNGHVFESSPHKYPEWTTSSRTPTGSVRTLGVSGLYPKHLMKEQSKDETIAPGNTPQYVPPFSSAATRMNEVDETIITSIRVTDVGLGLRKVPTGFYTVVRHSGIEWRTENKRPPVNNDVVEWSGPIPIPSDLSATIRLEVYASFEFQPMLDTGERLQKLTVTVEKLLDCSENGVPFIFLPKNADVVSHCSSILVTVKRQQGENDLSTWKVLGSTQTPTDVTSSQSPRLDIHPDIDQVTSKSVPLPASEIGPIMSSASRDLESEYLDATAVPPSAGSDSSPPIHPSQSVSETNISHELSQLQPTPLTRPIQVQGGRDISLKTSSMRPSDSPSASFGGLTETTETITASVASAPLSPSPSSPASVTESVSGAGSSTSAQMKRLATPSSTLQPSRLCDLNVPLAAFPRPVAVNPTPHPTPPTTPLLYDDAPGAPQPPSTFFSLPLLPQKTVPSTEVHGQREPQPPRPLIYKEPLSPDTLTRVVDAGSKAQHPARLFLLQRSPEDASSERGDGSIASRKSPSDMFETSSAMFSRTETALTDVDSGELAFEKTNAKETRLREAALEARRQRDLFAKVPKRSYSNRGRTQSGLLSQLMKPDPLIFPPNHGKVEGNANTNTQSRKTIVVVDSSSEEFETTDGEDEEWASEELDAEEAEEMVANPPPPSAMKRRESEKKDYHYKEMEDDSGDDVDDKIRMSQSVAQQKLQALMSRRSSDRGTSSHLVQPIAIVGPSTLSPATAPGHPYNIPAAAPPMTPRTTRRRMLKTELSESMRRQLLWERQVSTNPALVARRAAQGLGDLRPLTSRSSDAKKTADAQDEQRIRVMARNRSWADDYHYSGW